MKQIDLEPHEYKTEPRKGEPIFGPGWPIAVAVLASGIIGALVQDASTPVYIMGAIGGAVLGGLLQQIYR